MPASVNQRQLEFRSMLDTAKEAEQRKPKSASQENNEYESGRQSGFEASHVPTLRQYTARWTLDSAGPPAQSACTHARQPSAEKSIGEWETNCQTRLPCMRRSTRSGMACIVHAGRAPEKGSVNEE